MDPLEHDPAGLVVTVDEFEVGALLATDEGWIGFRPGWVDACPRTRRRDALRRLLMSHPAGTFGVRPANREGPR